MQDVWDGFRETSIPFLSYHRCYIFGVDEDFKLESTFMAVDFEVQLTFLC